MRQSYATERHYPANLLAQYDLLQHLGGSDRASVHLARDRVLGQVVAIKLFRGELGRDPARVAHLYSRARAATGLGHPNIVAVYDHGAAWRAAFITMEYVAGRDLAMALAREGTPPPRRAAAIVAQVLSALAAAHGAGLAHGDLHPRNVLLRGDGDGVVLTDFGMAPHDAPAGPAGAWITELARYRAPELDGGQEAGQAADIFATGAILRAALAPAPDAAGAAASRSNGLAAGLLEIAERACAPEPAARYPSAAIMRADLLAVAGPLALPAPTVPLAAVGRRWHSPGRARHAATVALAALLVLGGLGGTGALVRSRVAQEEPAPAAVELPPEATAEPATPTVPPSPTTRPPTATATARPALAATAPAIAPPPAPTAMPAPTATPEAPTPTAAATVAPEPTAAPTPEPTIAPTATGTPRATVTVTATPAAPRQPTATTRPAAPPVAPPVVSPAAAPPTPPPATLAPTPRPAPTPTLAPNPTPKGFNTPVPIIEVTPTPFNP